MACYKLSRAYTTFLKSTKCSPGVPTSFNLNWSEVQKYGQPTGSNTSWPTMLCAIWSWQFTSSKSFCKKFQIQAEEPLATSDLFTRPIKNMCGDSYRQKTRVAGHVRKENFPHLDLRHPIWTLPSDINIAKMPASALQKCGDDEERYLRRLATYRKYRRSCVSGH